jgi:hypothetical protein
MSPPGRPWTTGLAPNRRTQEVRPASMEQDTYPDPIREALGHGMTRVIQVASSVVTGAQALVYLSRDHAIARRQTGDAALLAAAGQQRAEQATARSGLAASRDPGWLNDANLNRTIQAWAAVMPYADPSLPWHHQSAATAMRQAEERLRVLHPTAMARYEQLRFEGADPAHAMIQAVPLFGHPPGPRSTSLTPPQRFFTTSSTITPNRPGPVQADGAAVTAAPWEQDFPLSIGEVLAATSERTAGPTAAKPAVSPRAARTGRQP